MFDGVRIVALLFAASSLASAQNAADPPCRADYTIRARYEEADRGLNGELTVRWTNTSRDDVPDLWFHTYWNAYANNESTHLVEAGGALRGVGIGDDEWGWQRITSFVVDDVELAPTIEWISPDDKREQDRTVFRVKLPQIAKKGSVVTARVAWESRIPRVRRRTGYKDDFLFIAHWFPQLGVYETGNGWNCHQFHANTEFFSDYGTYEVELDLPAAYADRIGASGVATTPAGGGAGRVVTHFSAPSQRDRDSTDRTGRHPLVHGFTWTADKHYVKYEETFRFDDWAERFPDEVDRVALALGRSRSEMRLRDVAVTVLLQPEHASQAKRHYDATCTALFFYGLWWGEYPYEHVTCVDPAYGGGAAGGMEYPTLFTAGTRLFTKSAMQTPESVTVHECGHQFWYGLVGNNEFEGGWLDEGFNTFSQNEALMLRYGLSIVTTDFSSVPFDGVALLADPGGSRIADALSARRIDLPFGIELRPLRASGILDWWRRQPLLTFARQRSDPREGDRNGYLSDPETDPVDMPGWLYCDRNSYRTNSYRRTATALRSLQGLVSNDRFLRGMRLYSERWRYGHPYAQDFFDAFQEGAKADIAWYFETAFRSTATVDWKIEVEQRRAASPKGWFPDATGQWAKRAKDGAKEEEESSPTGNSDGKAAKDPNASWHIDLVLRRRGEMLLPLTLELTWNDGTKERFTWSREEQAHSTWWKPLAARPPSALKLASAVIDPDRRYTFDRNMADNEWHEAVDDAAPLRWAERVFAQYLHGLHAFGGLGG